MNLVDRKLNSNKWKRKGNSSLHTGIIATIRRGAGILDFARNFGKFMRNPGLTNRKREYLKIGIGMTISFFLQDLTDK